MKALSALAVKLNATPSPAAASLLLTWLSTAIVSGGDTDDVGATMSGKVNTTLAVAE